MEDYIVARICVYMLCSTIYGLLDQRIFIANKILYTILLTGEKYIVVHNNYLIVEEFQLDNVNKNMHI